MSSKGVKILAKVVFGTSCYSKSIKTVVLFVALVTVTLKSKEKELKISAITIWYFQV